MFGKHQGFNLTYCLGLEDAWKHSAKRGLKRWRYKEVKDMSLRIALANAGVWTRDNDSENIWTQQFLLCSSVHPLGKKSSLAFVIFLSHYLSLYHCESCTFIIVGDDIANAGHIPQASGDYVPQKCWNFTLGDWKRQEFYSPQFPDVYPNNTECMQLLKGTEYICKSALHSSLFLFTAKEHSKAWIKCKIKIFNFKL